MTYPSVPDPSAPGAPTTAPASAPPARSTPNPDAAIVWLTGADGQCSFLSDSWYAFTGQPPASGLGHGWIDALHPDDRARVEAEFNVANAHRSPMAMEYRLRRHDGDYRWALDAASPRFEPAGEFLGFAGYVVDVHDRREIEATLRLQSELLSGFDHHLTKPVDPVVLSQLIRTLSPM